MKYWQSACYPATESCSVAEGVWKPGQGKPAHYEILSHFNMRFASTLVVLPNSTWLQLMAQMELRGQPGWWQMYGLARLIIYQYQLFLVFQNVSVVMSNIIDQHDIHFLCFQKAKIQVTAVVAGDAGA